MNERPDQNGPASARVADVVAFLRNSFPLALAQPWDNVGLLWGDDQCPVSRVMTCLTLTEDVAREAAERGAELVVSHHPILFRPVQRLTAHDVQGRMLLTLAARAISVYCAHTAYDDARDGINDFLAQTLGLRTIDVLRAGPPAGEAATSAEPSGSGRLGVLPSPLSLAELVALVKSRFGLERVDYTGPVGARIERLAVACGSGGEFLDDALNRECHALLTGEARFHTCIEARERGVGLILMGHFASERPAMVQLAQQIRARFPAIEVWASEVETDPIERG